ncbi:MAG: glycosyltransferase [Candidatus Pacearchaeota archaeon]
MVIPTYNEKENISKLIKGIQKEFKENKIKGEIIVVDDNSPDGTGKILEDLKKKQKNLKVIHRNRKLGLSSAVLEGWKIADGEVLGVMDADLSHSPKKIKELFLAIKNKEVYVIFGDHIIKPNEEYQKIKEDLDNNLLKIFSCERGNAFSFVYKSILSNNLYSYKHKY